MYRVLLLCGDGDVASHIKKYVTNVNPEIVFLEAADAGKALEALRIGDGVDVVVCDHDPPATDGLAFFDRMCRDPSAVRPMILMSKRPDGELAIRAFRKQIDYYISREGGSDFYVNMAEEIVICSEKRRNELQRRVNTERLMAVSKLASLKSRPFDEVLKYALETSVSITRSTIGYVAVYDNIRHKLKMIAWSMGALRQCRVADRPMEYDLDTAGVWADPIRKMRTVIINDYGSDSSPSKKGTPMGHVKLERLLMVPVIHNEVPMATAGVGNKRSDYTEDDGVQLHMLMDSLVSIYEVSLFRRQNARTESLLETLTSAAPGGLMYLSLDTKYVICNPYAQRLLRIDGSELVNGWFRECRGDGAQPILALIEDVGMDGVTRETYFSTSLDDRRIGIVATVSASRDSTGTPSGFFVTLTDVSRLRAAARQHGDTDGRIKIVGRFVERELSGASEDIASVLAGGPAGPLRKDRERIDAVVDYFRRQRKVASLPPAWMELRSCLRAPIGGPRLEADVGDCRILADENFPQVFSDLMEYSRRRGAGTVRVWTEMSEDRFRIRYSDDGAGIPGSLLGLLFAGHTSEGMWTLLVGDIVRASGFHISDRGSGPNGLEVTIDVPSGNYSADLV